MRVPETGERQRVNAHRAITVNYGLIQGAGETRIEHRTGNKCGQTPTPARLTLTTPQYSGAGWLQATNLILNAANNANTGRSLPTR